MKSDSLPPASGSPFMKGVVVDGEARSLALPFRVFAERLPHFVWETDAAGRSIYESERWHAYTGLGRGLRMTDGWLTVVHEEDRARMVALQAGAMATGCGYEAACRFRRAADGVYRWFRVRGAPVHDDHGTLVGWVGTYTDVHERRLVEERQAIAQEAASAGIYDCDLVRGRMIADECARELWGRSAAEAMTYEDMLAGVHPEDVTALQAAMMQAIAPDGTGLFSTEYRVRGEAPWQWIATMGRVYAEQGAMVRVVGVVQDITARRETESALRAAAEAAEAANRAKDEFVACISHELRAPLTPSMLVAGMYAEAPELGAEIREGFAMILRNLEQEVRLIDDLMDLARTQQGKMRFEMAPCDLRAIVVAALHPLEPEWRRKEVQLTPSLGSVPALLGDAQRLQQLVSNLVRNAIKFTPSGGTIEVRLEKRPSQRLRLTVKDSGCGLAPADLESIFEPLVQTKSGRRIDNDGLGLGLAISRCIVAAHHGRLWAESEGLGHGAEFLTELPLSQLPP